MRVYSWDQVFHETGISAGRIKYAIRLGHLSFPKAGANWVIDSEGLMAIIRYYRDKPRYKHLHSKKVEVNK